ncbi:MAG TPA: helix-turn-helix transcriptional regulator [Flavobacteriales bacterium]|nr:helix-turn-helix transcriptional regulator [Flavobacteriales bacterium]
MAPLPCKPELLTNREREYLALVCRYPKPSPQEVAECMHLSVKTVDKHCTKLYRKLGVQNYTDMYHRAVHLGLVKCMCGRAKGHGEEGEGEAPDNG